jgi:hypothetical protein
LQGFADDRVVPYVQNWNVSVQHELVKNLTLEVRYVGSKGNKLRSAKELNTINIFENGILDAFNTTRAGGATPLFDQMLNGITISAITVGRNGTGSEALRNLRRPINGSPTGSRVPRGFSEQLDHGYGRSRRPAAPERIPGELHRRESTVRLANFMGTTIVRPIIPCRPR